MSDTAPTPPELPEQVAAAFATGPQVADVTVIMPAHNGAETIARALTSVRRQTVRPAGVVVVDDGSADDTAAVARKAGRELGLNLTVLVNERSEGSGPSRNTAIQRASTRWIAFLDCDDEWQSDHLEASLLVAEGKVLVTAPAVDSAGLPRGNVSGTLMKLSPSRCFVPDNPVVTSATVADRQTVLRVGGFRPLRRAQDLDLWARMLEQGPGVARPSVAATYHLHATPPNQASHAIERACLSQVLDTYADRSWMTRQVRNGCMARMEWDDLRLAQREQRWYDAGRHVMWFVRHPAALPGLVGTFRVRRRARQVRTVIEHFAR